MNMTCWSLTDVISIILQISSQLIDIYRSLLIPMHTCFVYTSLFSLRNLPWIPNERLYFCLFVSEPLEYLVYAIDAAFLSSQYNPLDPDEIISSITVLPVAPIVTLTFKRKKENCDNDINQLPLECTIQMIVLRLSSTIMFFFNLSIIVDDRNTRSTWLEKITRRNVNRMMANYSFSELRSKKYKNMHSFPKIRKEKINRFVNVFSKAHLERTANFNYSPVRR